MDTHATGLGSPIRAALGASRRMLGRVCVRRIPKALKGASKLVILAALALVSGLGNAAKLTIDNEVVVKFGADAGLTVRESLQTNRRVVMTSIHDDSAANQTGSMLGEPAAGDWRGLKVEDSVTAGGLQINGLTLRYAGASGSAALQVAQDYTIQFLNITDSLLGLRTVGNAHPIFGGLSLVANAVGLEVREDALPTLTGSEVRGNTDFGILNLSSQTTQASGTWWGAVTGPTDPVGNPNGTGDKVSAGVNYGAFSTTVPLIDCSVVVADGNYTVSLPSVTVALECRNAETYRLSSTTAFSGDPQPFAPTANFVLSGGPGNKTIYAEFRASSGNVLVAALPQPIQYTPGKPVVYIVAPDGTTPIATDTTIVATATDAAGIDHVDFYVDAILLGTDATSPYEMAWSLTGFANGNHTIEVVATSIGTQQTGQATRTVTVQRPVDDTDGPSIADVRFSGQPLSNGMTLTASGTLTFDVTDPSGIDDVTVQLDDAVLAGGLLLNDTYSVDVELDGIADGPHVITIAAADTLGNTSERVFDVTINTGSAPEAPVVTITAPTANAQITTDTTVSATVAGTDIAQVDFYVDDGLIGSLPASSSYDMPWLIGGVANGVHAIQVVATNANQQRGQATVSVAVQHPGGADTTGPSISNVRFAGQPLTEGQVLTASGTLSFAVADLSGVQSAGVAFDGETLSGGALSGSTYSVSLNLDGTTTGSHTILLQASDTLGNASESLFHIMVDTSGDSESPTVAITFPQANAQIAGDTTIVATATGSNITRVDFYVDTTWIGGATSAPYQTVWQIAGFANGSHTLKAIATNANNQIGLAAIPVSLQQTSDDTTGPTISDARFAGQPLASGVTLTGPGLLTFEVADPSGVAGGAVFVGTSEASGGGISNGRYSVLLDFASMPNGEYTFTLRATDGVGNMSEQAFERITIVIPPPPTPTILVPADPAQTQQPIVPVSGMALPASQVQLYLNGNAAGASFQAAFDGKFSATVTLPAEGTHTLTATAQTSRGTSVATPPVFVTYSAPAPSVVITSPPDDAVIDATAPVAVNASVVDAIGVDHVTLKVDGQTIGTPQSAAPFNWSWTVDSSVNDGPHTLSVTAVNLVGKSTTATRSISVLRTPPPPPPVQTAYTGTLQPISPASSYGDVPILLAGSAVDTSTGEPVPNALLKIVLQVNGFQRRIGISTDATGQFSYRFVPQPSDAGTYTVSVIHPDQTDLPDQGQFTINRLGLNPTQYALQAARTVSSTIRIIASASAGQGTSGVSLTANPADQPSGSLPAGITIDTPPPVNVPSGGSVPIDVVFTAGDHVAAPADTGVVVLTATDGSGHVRGSVTINYTLGDPKAALYPQPSSLQTGVTRGQQVTETVQITNRGLAPAANLQVSLAEFSGPQGPAAVPAWIYLASPGSPGDLAVGASHAIQIVATPTEDVGDGIYSLKILVSAQGISGYVWVSVAVTPFDKGGLLFLAKDIYTCIPDCVTTPGLANASIRVQNEAVYTVTGNATTDAQGNAEILDLPTGHYRYIATAANHATATGRVTVRPGLSVAQEVFLDYELVTFEWSVTETTIQDHYDVTLTATYQTQVPAPVMLIEPPSINLPDMQEGEELTGEITIINRGLVRADNVVWFPAQSDDYFQIDFMGSVPETFEAQQSYRLPYRVIKKCMPLPGMEGGSSCQDGTQANSQFKMVKSGSTSTAGTCHAYSNQMHVEFGYQCAAGDQRSGSAWSGFNKAYGQNCSGSGGGGGGGGGGGAGGWGGGGGGSPIGTPMSSGPGCVPVCPDCNGGGPGG